MKDVPSIVIGVAKRPKEGIGESGDTVELVERPRGGFSVIIVDGQGSGPGAKRTSHHIVNRAAALIAEGARDGAVVRAVHDALYTMRNGQVSATLTLISADVEAETLLVSQGGAVPVILKLADDETTHILEGTERPLGVHVRVRPKVTQLPLRRNQVVVACTDGVVQAGKRLGQPAFGPQGIADCLCQMNSGFDAQRLAETILTHAVAADMGRARDDMAVVVLGITNVESTGVVRKLYFECPF